LGQWLRVYDYQTALDHAEMWMEGLDEQELRESFDPKVKKKIPTCLRNVPKLRYSRVVIFPYSSLSPKRYDC